MKAEVLYSAVVKYGSTSLGMAVLKKKAYSDLSKEDRETCEKLAQKVETAWKKVDAIESVEKDKTADQIGEGQAAESSSEA